jgi:thymidine kinase
MYAEKSTELIRHYRRYNISKKKCLLVKFKGDTRYTNEDFIATHDQVHQNAIAVSCHRLSDLESLVDLRTYEVICIDEIQFYPDKMEYCKQWRDSGKIIIACGLYSDFQRKPFSQMPELIAISDKVEFLNAVCMDCGMDQATTSYRHSEETTQIVIGGHEKYMPLCQRCYEQRTDQRNHN